MYTKSRGIPPTRDIMKKSIALNLIKDRYNTTSCPASS